MEYSYQVSAINSFGWSESDPSESAVISTSEYVGSAPEFSSAFEDFLLAGIDINEDSSHNINLDGVASDVDGDVINFIAEPVLEDTPIVCSITDDLLTLTPSANYNGSYEIKLIAYDDHDPYESNTLTDVSVFSLNIAPINDAPILVNDF